MPTAKIGLPCIDWSENRPGETRYTRKDVPPVCLHSIRVSLSRVVRRIASVGRESDGSRALLAVIESARGNRNLADPCTSISVNLTPSRGQLTGQPSVGQKNAGCFTRSRYTRMKEASRRF